MTERLIDGVIVFAVIVLAVLVVEAFERWRAVMFPPRRPDESARIKRLQADAIADAAEQRERQRLDRLFPPTKGPHGFAGQLDRRGDRRPTVTEFPKSRMN